MSSGFSRSITAETPSPPKDSLYSLQPTSRSSVLIFRKSSVLQPPSACSDSTPVIFTSYPLVSRLLGIVPQTRPARGLGAHQSTGWCDELPNAATEPPPQYWLRDDRGGERR